MLGTKKERPPNPSFMSDDQMSQYLKELRTSKSRPSGSRPPPPSKFASLRRIETERAPEPPADRERPALLQSNSMPIVPVNNPFHRRARSSLSINNAYVGRAIATPPPSTLEEEQSGQIERPAIRRTPSAIYMENGTRWMEKQEAKSLRMALEDMDLAEEKKLHNAAQQEAAELVWKHRNPDAPSKNPDSVMENPDLRRDYRAHLRQGSYTRSHSQEVVPRLVQSPDSERSSSDLSDSLLSSKTRKISPPTASIKGQKQRTPSGKSYGDLAEAVKKDITEARRRSSGSRRILSGEKKIFMHPDDKIFEDPQEEGPSPRGMPPIPNLRPTATPIQPVYVRKNPFARVRMQQDRPERSNSAPVLSQPVKHNSVEIQKNPPSQSRNAWYMHNDPLPTAPPKTTAEEPTKTMSTGSLPTKDGREIRSDDIRAATSKQRSERSPNLPQPTLVSDKPGRPIVSFQKVLKPKEIVLEEIHTPAVSAMSEPTKKRTPTNSPLPSPARPGAPAARHSYRPTTEASIPSVPRANTINIAQASSMPIPILNLPDDPAVPSLVLPEEPDFASSSARSAPPTPFISIDPPTISVQAPSIGVSGPAFSTRPTAKPPQRPLPTPTQQHYRHAATSPIPRSTPHYSPSVRQSGVLCAQCAMPIAGRILSAAGERFHPSCFVCHECHTNLELVAFYPEPEKQRGERLARISARHGGFEHPSSEGMTREEVMAQDAADGDSTLRFYCHLDFHELFSPRCKSCKTPIEGEVVVACGAEWHVGHFFCAQCGDPFDSTTPFVEKDGYAWCVGCHTNRYSSKCRKCRKPVTDVVVKALGSDWHSACFCCLECDGEFEDGRYFLRGESEDPVCVKCEERRLKS